MNLVLYLKNSDEAAFKESYLLFKEKVYNYFLKKTFSKQEAEDLMQECFFRLWKYRKSLCEDYLLEQHLFNIARTVFIDHTRRLNKQRKIVTALKTKTAADESIVIDNETFDKEKLEKLLSDMPVMRKKIFLMNKFEGYSYKQIAQKLSVDTKMVDNHISRALKQLRKSFLSFFF